MNELVPFAQKFPAVSSRGIDEPTWNTLKTSLYPGANDDSILMVVDYCTSRKLDPLMKPVHIVPMNTKDAKTGKYEWKDVVMPGINTYRIMAARSGDLAGTASPKFGPETTSRLGNVDFTYPEWAEVTVTKLIGDRLVEFTAKEYFTENFANKKDGAPNAMWAKRPKGQLAKCAEAQALRKGWPEIGQQPTYEEMVGKVEIDVTPVRANDMEAVKQAITQEKPKKINTTQSVFDAYADSMKPKKISTTQSVFDAYAEAIENAQHPGELQTAFGEGWTLLGQSKASKAVKDSLKALYEEKKAYFEGLEANE